MPVSSVRLTFGDTDSLLLQDVANLFADLELAYDFGVLITDPKYGSYRFTQYFWYRNRKQPAREDKLRAIRISQQSPLDLSIVGGSITAVWIFLQILDRVSTWTLSREKMRLEIRKLELEIENLQQDQPKTLDAATGWSASHMEKLVHARDAKLVELRITHRLEQSPMRLERISVTEEDIKAHYGRR